LKITGIEPRDDHQVKIVAEFEPETLEKFKGKAARQIAAKAKIPGFRPGKAPYDVIARLYGESEIEDNALELMLQDMYPAILKEANVEPAAPGNLEDIDKGETLRLTFVVPLEPTVDLGNYREIRKDYSPQPLAENQVNEFIQRLRRTYATAEPVDRPAESGDLIYVNVDATIIQPADVDHPELLKDSPLQLVIGENDPEENNYPFPGFGDEFIGLAPNAEKTFHYTYPQDSQFEQLRGKEVEFHAVLQNVKKLTLPEVDEEFIKMFGDYENVEKFTESVKAQLEATQNNQYDQDYVEQVLDEITSQSTVKFPPQILNQEMDHVVDSVTHDLSHQHLDLETYLKTLKKEKDAWLEEEVKPAAARNLTKTLIMQELARVEDIQMSNEELQAEAGNILTEMQQSVDTKTLEKQLKNKEFINSLTMQAATRVMNRKIFERIKAIATGNLAEKESAKEMAENIQTEAEAPTPETEAENVTPKAKKTTTKKRSAKPEGETNQS
jgi:trigger factor